MAPTPSGAAIARLHDLSEAEMRAAIADLPDGTYEGEDFLDDGGPGGRPRASTSASPSRGDEAVFDLSGSDDRLPNFCNTTPFIARSAVIYAARILSGRDMQQNAGALRPLTIITRPGSMLRTRAGTRRSPPATTRPPPASWTR